MDKAEILQAEIKKKICFIESHFSNLRNAENEIEKNIPKYLDTISTLKKENADLKAERDQLDEQHSQDLKQIEELIGELSLLVEPDHA